MQTAPWPVPPRRECPPLLQGGTRHPRPAQAAATLL